MVSIEAHTARATRGFEIIDDTVDLRIDHEHTGSPLAADEDQPGVPRESTGG
jgi:hypothetical protein